MRVRFSLQALSRLFFLIFVSLRTAAYRRLRYVKSLAWNLAAGAYYCGQSRELFAQLGERAYRNRTRHPADAKVEALMDPKILATIAAIHKKLRRFEHRVQRLKKLVRRAKGAQRVGYPVT